MTAIEWTDETWNPVTGCTKVSPGCKHCYAETVAHRFWATQYPYVGRRCSSGPRQFTDIQCHEDRLAEPLKWRRPRRIFVNSMSDLFHEMVPDEFTDRVFAIMALCPQHVFQVLTKRVTRMRDYCASDSTTGRLVRLVAELINGIDGIDCHYANRADGLTGVSLGNVWLGVSVENQRLADERIPLLLQTPATVRFISAEPLLGDIDISRFLTAGDSANPSRGSEHSRTDGEATPDVPRPAGLATGATAKHDGAIRQISGTAGSQNRLDWVIVGGESGAQARPCHLAWIRSIRDQCRSAGVPCFIKQLGRAPRFEALFDGDTIKDRVLKLEDRKGGHPAEWPTDLVVREWPEVVV